MANEIVIYTDGACLGNPGPGGYGIVIKESQQRIELSAGYRLTTNNRMELMAAIVALESLQKPGQVRLFSDSRYLVNAVNQGWVANWKNKKWKRGSRGVPNTDLWKRLLVQNEKHQVTYQWVEGHAGNRENERCDRLSVAAAKGKNLPVDEGYENNQPLQDSLLL